jgi:TolB-like protein/DNA-binding winged helix-turn-helix (wHTH) protein/Flp pilus assembly protein TadD
VSKPVPAPFRFEEFDLDLERYELRRSGQAVKLERIPMELLILLLQSNGKLVRREAINRRLWGESAYQDTDHSVNTAVNKLRYILRDDPRDPRFIQTVVGQGYRFIAEVAADPFLEEAALPLPGVQESEASRLTVGTSPELILPEPVATPVAPIPLTVKAAPAEIIEEPDTRPEHPVPTRRPFVFVVLTILVALLGAAAFLYLHRSRSAQDPKEAIGGFHSIAVLPFVNLAQNSDQDYIVDGMTDQLITDLAGSTPLRVISRRSVMQYKGVQVPMREIAETLDVDAVLEGSFLHNGTQVRITADLIDARNDRHLWAQVYEESGNDLLTIQESVTKDIVHDVALALGSGVSTSQVRPLNVEARDFYLRGRFLWNKRTPASLEKSVVFYQNAINADPRYAEAYAALGIAYVVLTGYGSDPSNSLAKAQSAAESALRLGGGEAEAAAEAHTVLGAVKIERDRDWAGAEVEYRQALELDPSYPTAHHWYSLHLSRLGRMKEAEIEIQRARALDPLSPMIGTDAAETAYWARNPSEAMARIREVLVRNPNFAEAYLSEGKILEQQRHYEQALAAYKTGSRFFGSDTAYVQALQANALASAGASEQARQMAKQLEDLSAHSYVSGVDLAVIYCALGDQESALRWLGRAQRNGDREMGLLSVDPIFDGCRSDRRYQDLLKQLRLRPAG